MTHIVNKAKKEVVLIFISWRYSQILAISSLREKNVRVSSVRKRRDLKGKYNGTTLWLISDLHGHSFQLCLMHKNGKRDLCHTAEHRLKSWKKRNKNSKTGRGKKKAIREEDKSSKNKPHKSRSRFFSIFNHSTISKPNFKTSKTYTMP